MDQRIASIESFRVLAIFGVILWHTDLLGKLHRLGGERLLIDLTLDLIWWISLPYFFITAGYFFGHAVRIHEKPIVHLRRYASFLVWPLLAWLCIYTVVPRNWPVEVRDHGWWQPFYSTALKNVNLFGTQHVTLFLDGHVPVWHLWFLPALLFSLAVVALLAGWRLQRYVILLIIGLYALALTEEVAGYFAHATVHLGPWSIAMLFTVLGWWLVGRRQPAISTALYMIVGGYAFALMEGEIMKAFFHLPPIAIMNHYYLGGIVLALGIFMLALAKPHMGQSTPLPFLAQFTFGIYVCHIFVIYTLIPVRERIEHLFPVLTPLWLGLFLLAVYFLAMLFTVVLSKIPLGRYLVTRPARMRHTYQCLTNRNE